MTGKYRKWTALSAALVIMLPAMAVAEKVSFEPVRAPSKGPDDAVVTVIEIADFMWPFCKEAGPAFKRLYEEYEGRIRFVFVPYMRKYSQLSRDAALAAYAAWDQGRFWEMHDLLFEKAPDLEREFLEESARKLGLDMARFQKALNDMEHLDELKKNLDLVHDLDIWSTPTAIINGNILKGSQPYENYKRAVDEALGLSRRSTNARSPASLLLRFVSPVEAHAGDEFGRGTVPLYVKVPTMRPTNEPVVGEEAPDFSLPSIIDTEVSLSDYRGKKNVLLTFLPAAFTPVWTGQLAAYEELKERFAALDAQVLGVLTDNVPTLKAWAEGINLSFPVLSDYWPHGHVSLKYDVLRSEGVAERAVFVIDKKGIIRYIDIHNINEDPGMNAILRTLEEIEGHWAAVCIYLSDVRCASDRKTHVEIHPAEVIRSALIVFRPVSPVSFTSVIGIDDVNPDYGGHETLASWGFELIYFTNPGFCNIVGGIRTAVLKGPFFQVLGPSGH